MSLIEYDKSFIAAHFIFFILGLACKEVSFVNPLGLQISQRKNIKKWSKTMNYGQHSNLINVGYRNKAKSLVCMFNKELLNFNCTRNLILRLLFIGCKSFNVCQSSANFIFPIQYLHKCLEAAPVNIPHSRSYSSTENNCRKRETPCSPFLSFLQWGLKPSPLPPKV